MSSSSRARARSDSDVRHHALVLLAVDPARAAGCVTNDQDAGASEREQRRYERFIAVALGSLREYILLAQQQHHQIQAPASAGRSDTGRAATAGSDDERAPRRRRDSRHDDNKSPSAPVDSGALDGCARLLLSVNVLTAANARAIASQHVGMERPVAVSRRNPRLLRDVCARVEACLSRAQTQTVSAQSCSSGRSSNTAETAVGGHVADALVRALEWFADSSFAVSVIAPADAIAGLSSSGGGSDFSDSDAVPRQTGALARALRRLGSVQFVLHRSDDERPERAAQNILHLLGAIRDSGNPRCEVRQVEDAAFQTRGVVKEWLFLASPSVTATIAHLDASASSDSSTDLALTLVIRSNYVLPTTASASGLPLAHPLHSGMRCMEIVHVAPMASTHAEFFVMAPAAAEREGVEFLLFRVASAEEVLVPPPRTGTHHQQQQQQLALGPYFAEAEDAAATATLASIRAIPRDDFNPFRYESGLAARDTAGAAPPTHHSVPVAARATAATTALRTDSASFGAAIDQRVTSRTRSAAVAAAAPTTQMQSAKRKKLL